MQADMDFNRAEPNERNRFQLENARLIVLGHLRLLQRELLPDTENGLELARCLYHAPFVVLAHDTAPDPVFFYANRSAQELFEMTWQEMVRLPSRHSAEPVLREERERLLACVARQGYIEDYAGIRISATGKRFRIAKATVWNLTDDDGHTVGQAAAFSDWTKLLL
jgi:hypothetical protein